MSLINEALLRAEAEKRDNATTLDFTPAATDPVEVEPAPGVYPARIAFYGLIIVAAAAVSWLAVNGRVAPARTLAAEASPTETTSPAKADARRTIAQTVASLQYYQPPAPPAAKGAVAAAEATTSPATGGAQAAAAEPAATTRGELSDAAVTRGFHPGAYKLSAIINGPNGETAIINGKFVQVGSIIHNAEVVKISGQSVDLRVDGKVHTIQL